jgi:hypothetical protein
MPGWNHKPGRSLIASRRQIPGKRLMAGRRLMVGRTKIAREYVLYAAIDVLPQYFLRLTCVDGGVMVAHKSLSFVTS